MSKYLVQTVETIRVGTTQEVDQLQKEFQNDSSYFLAKFEYTHKEIRERGEVVEEYELVKATKVFNNVKEPDSNVEVSYIKSFSPNEDYDIDEVVNSTEED